MKKLITILFLFAFAVQAQFKNIPQDKVNHATCGFMNGSGYCVHDLHYASGGGFVGSITVSIITWKIIPKRKLPMKVQIRLDDESNMERIK